MLLNPSSCVQSSVMLNKLKHQILEYRKIYHKSQARKMSSLCPNTQTLKDFGEEFLKGKFVRSATECVTLLVHRCCRVVLQESQSSASSSNQSQGLHAQCYYVVNSFHLVRSLVSTKQYRNVHQMLLSMSFREEPKIL